MALPLHLLLRLPPALRCHAVEPFLARANNQHLLRHLSKPRTFNTTSKALQRQPPQPIRTSKPQPPSARPLRDAPPTATPPPMSRAAPPQAGTLQQLLQKLTPENPSFLLYRAPRHGSFIVTSYAAALAFTYAALHQGYSSINAIDVPTFFRYLWSFLSIVYIVGATGFVLAPRNLVRTIRLTRTNLALPISHLGGQSKPRVIIETAQHHGEKAFELPLKVATLASAIPSGSKFSYHSIPVSQIEEFTNSKPPKAERNIWATLVQNTRRMVMRDGMAYLHIPTQGYLKLDVKGCELVGERDWPLLMDVLDVDTGRYLRTWQRRIGQKPVQR